MTVHFFLVFSFVQAPDISLDRFYELYQKAHSRCMKRYNNLRIVERKTWTNDSTRVIQDGSLCGDYANGFTNYTDATGKRTVTQTCLTRDLLFIVRKNQKSGEWALTKYDLLNTGKSAEINKANYARERLMSTGALPDAFLLPFSYNGRSPWINLLERICKSDKKIALEKIEAIGSSSGTGYRVTYSFRDETNRTVETSFLEFAPNLLWMVTKGGSWISGFTAGQEWTIEYGDKLDGVPILKKCVFYQVTKDASGKTIPDPSAKPIIIEVTSFEPYDSVDEKDYDPKTYGVELPEYWDPDRAAEIPLALWIGLGGMVVFILGVLLIHLSRRRGKKIVPGSSTPQEV